MPQHQCPIIGFNERDSDPMLVSIEEKCPIDCVSSGNGAPSLVSVGEIVPEGTDIGKQGAKSSPWAIVWRPLVYTFTDPNSFCLNHVSKRKFHSFAAVL